MSNDKYRDPRFNVIARVKARNTNKRYQPSGWSYFCICTHVEEQHFLLRYNPFPIMVCHGSGKRGCPCIKFIPYRHVDGPEALCDSLLT